MASNQSNQSEKQVLSFDDPVFDLKMLLVSDPGGGKTHLSGTYTGGPTHYYMMDPGGQKTLRKILKLRKATDPLITIDIFDKAETKYNDFWKTIQQDARRGFFDNMREENGLVVVDSLTACNDAALAEVAKRNNRSLLDGKAPMQIQHWGQLISWMKQLIATINDLPCAAIMTAHIVSETDSDGAVIARYPAMNGQFKSQIGRFFDEIYLLDKIGSAYRVNFSGANKFSGSSRIFEQASAKNINLDAIAKAYLSGETTIKDGK